MSNVSIIVVLESTLHVFHQINVLDKTWQFICYVIQCCFTVFIILIKQGVFWITQVIHSASALLDKYAFQ